MGEVRQPIGQGSGPEPADDPGWSDRPDEWEPDAPLRVPPMPVLHLDGFDGPMDLLLDLAERQRIDLGIFSMVALAEQFAAATERLIDTVTLEQRAGWLVLATRLVLLRSRLLVPASPDAAVTAAKDAVAELDRHGELAFVRAAASWLQRRPQLGTDVLVRPPQDAPGRSSGYVALMEACLSVLRGRAVGLQGEETPLYRLVVPDLWRVADALARIRAVLAGHPEGGELGRFLPAVAADDPQRPLKARAVVASTLLAGLELVRAGQAKLDQDESFGVIHLRALTTAVSEDGKRAS